ncbi:MAG: hypothetical protein HS126_31255 [Anaerolineales bacterium]|nr:hypothetical protein [Anaerolineales bacterium]
MFNEDLKILSDTILLSLFATTRNISPQLLLFRQLYIIYHHLILSTADVSILNLPLRRLLRYSILLPFDLPVIGEKGSRISSVGVADLLVVKQHIKRYEATEIAHIENIMSGETRSREHRSLERIEETLTLEKETILEKEKELETSERFELNKETSKTIKEDQKYAFDLSVSAKYGPTVEINTGFELDVSVSTETSDKAASKYAKDVIERSLERVKEKIREERIRTIIRETEEKNLHSFINSDLQPHKVGIYQFLDKVYEAQVFNYGKRQMFDLMIPEPASYLWYLNNNETDSNSQGNLPELPEPLNVSAIDMLYLDHNQLDPKHFIHGHFLLT